MTDRNARICEEVKRELSYILQSGIKDPRMPKMVSVMKVEVTKDLKFAKAYISVFGSEEDKKNCLLALKSASGYIRHEIGRRVILRIVPQFTFVLDNSVEYGFNIDRILKEIGGTAGNDEQ